MITRNLRYSILMPVREQCNSTFTNPALCLTISKTSVIFCANSPTIFSCNHFRPLIPSTHFNPNFSLPDLVSILSSFLVLEKVQYRCRFQLGTFVHYSGLHWVTSGLSLLVAVTNETKALNSIQIILSGVERGNFPTLDETYPFNTRA